MRLRVKGQYRDGSATEDHWSNLQPMGDLWQPEEMAEASSSSNQPVTLHDLSTWGGELTSRIDGVDSRLSGVETRLGGIEDTMSTKDDLQQLCRELVHEFKA